MKKLPKLYCPKYQDYCLFENDCSWAELVTNNRTEAEAFIKSRNGHITEIKAWRNMSGAEDYQITYRTKG